MGGRVQSHELELMSVSNISAILTNQERAAFAVNYIPRIVTAKVSAEGENSAVGRLGIGIARCGVAPSAVISGGDSVDPNSHMGSGGCSAGISHHVTGGAR